MKLSNEEIVFLFKPVVIRLTESLKSVSPKPDQYRRDLFKSDYSIEAFCKIREEDDLLKIAANDLEIRTWIHRKLSGRFRNWNVIKVQTDIRRKSNDSQPKTSIESDDQILATYQITIDLYVP